MSSELLYRSSLFFRSSWVFDPNALQHKTKINDFIRSKNLTWVTCWLGCYRLLEPCCMCGMRKSHDQTILAFVKWNVRWEHSVSFKMDPQPLFQVCPRRRMSSACSCASRRNTIAQRPATWWTPPARPCAPLLSRGQATERHFQGLHPAKPRLLSTSSPLQDGSLHAAAPLAPGSGDIPKAGHSWHSSDNQPDGEGSHRVPRSSALDEGRVPRTGPRYLQAAGKVPQGGGCFLGWSQ